MFEEVEFLQGAAEKHHDWFRDSLPLIASENLISPLARQMLLTDFMDRYAEGLPGKRYYQGNVFVDEVERKTTELAERLFECEHADVRPISGTNANLAVLFGLLKPGDIITTVALSDGAHISTAKFGAVGVRGLQAITYPWDHEVMNIDVDGTAKLLREERPKVALFGQSVYLFPTPLKDLEDAFQEAGCHVWYDAAHVLGLIAGGQFQDPLREGAEIMTGSTHKTLPGPQHGILLANPRDDDTKKRLLRGVFPGTTSNHHLHAMAALGVTLAEHIEFGRDYAAQIVKNSKALGQALWERGFKVLGEPLGFTESHALALDVTEEGGGAKVAEDLEAANIITNKNLLPEDTSPIHPSGIRLGTQELTRLGMRENEMVVVAEFLARVAKKGDDPAAVKADVAEFKKGFNSIHYCFEEGTQAYRLWKLG